jgi:hypothetical protein
VNKLCGEVRTMIKGSLYVQASDSPGGCKAVGMFFEGSILRLFCIILLSLVFWFVTVCAPGAETSFVAVKNH